MQSKSLLIAIAAFAVTASGVHAFSSPAAAQRAGLNKEQVRALSEARELKESGDLTAARDKLVEVGITEDSLLAMRLVAKENRAAMQREGRHNFSTRKYDREDLTDIQREALRVARSNNDRVTANAILEEAGIHF